ncbi:hypothetical protein AB0N16_00810 [Streptomyces sp. NPDC051105]
MGGITWSGTSGTDRDGGRFLYRLEGARARFVARHDDVGNHV